MLNPNIKDTSSLVKRNPVQGGLGQWKKFEYFSFPTNPRNDFYLEVVKVFEFFKQAYVDFNFMDQQNDSINYTGVLVDQNYNSLPREIG